MEPSVPLGNLSGYRLWHTMPPCMISGVRGSAAEITCGHIVGVSNADEKKLAYLQMKTTDLNEPNNFMF